MLLCDIAECFDYFTRGAHASEDEDTPTGSHYNPLEICGGFVRRHAVCVSAAFNQGGGGNVHNPNRNMTCSPLLGWLPPPALLSVCSHRPQPGAEEAREEAFKKGPLAQLVSNAKAVRREQPAVDLVEVPFPPHCLCNCFSRSSVHACMHVQACAV